MDRGSKDDLQVLIWRDLLGILIYEDRERHRRKRFVAKSEFIFEQGEIELPLGHLEYPQLDTQQGSYNLFNHKLELKTAYFSSRG